MMKEIDQFKTEVTNVQRDLEALRARYQRAELLGGSDEEAVCSFAFAYENTCSFILSVRFCEFLDLKSGRPAENEIWHSKTSKVRHMEISSVHTKSIYLIVSNSCSATGQLQGAVATAEGALQTGITTLDELARQRERLEGARTGVRILVLDVL